MRATAAYQAVGNALGEVSVDFAKDLEHTALNVRARVLEVRHDIAHQVVAVALTQHLAPQSACASQTNGGVSHITLQ